MSEVEERQCLYANYYGRWENERYKGFGSSQLLLLCNSGRDMALLIPAPNVQTDLGTTTDRHASVDRLFVTLAIGIEVHPWNQRVELSASPGRVAFKTSLRYRPSGERVLTKDRAPRLRFECDSLSALIAL